MKKLTFLSIAAATLVFTGCGDKAKDAASNAAGNVTAAAGNVTAAAGNVTKAAAGNVTKAASDAAGNVTAAAAGAAGAAASAATAVDGKALFTACSACHGADGKTSALGKSKPIAGMAASSIEEKLHGYKAGTLDQYGQGAVMKGQAANLSDDQIKALADYISKL